MRVTGLWLGLVLAVLTILAACAPGGRPSAAPTGSNAGTGSGGAKEPGAA